jgi:predicted transcriptional regulator
MGYYRSRIEIISQILESANGGTTKTKIIYKAFLSYNQLKEYLTILTESGLLSYDHQTHIFKTTEKGFRFLNFYNEISDVIKESSLPPPQQQV